MNGSTLREVAILLLDDHVVVREGLRLLLERQPSFRVIAEASSVREALEGAFDPDVILADLMLPDRHGAEVVGMLRERFPNSRILVLTMVHNSIDVHQAFAAGAQGFMLKEAAATDLVEAVRRVAEGESYLQPSLGALLAQRREAPSRAPGSPHQLSRRELEVLKLLALGHTNAEVAGLLGVSLRTVEAHRSHISRKLNMRTRADLTRYAHETGLIQSG